MLYTDKIGLRKLRVLNVKRELTSLHSKYIDLFLGDAIETLDAEVVFSLIFKRKMLNFEESEIEAQLLQLKQLLSKLFNFYQFDSGGRSRKIQELQFPKNLQHLVCYIKSLERNEIFNKRTKRKINKIEFLRRRLVSNPIWKTINYFYPKIYNLREFEAFEKENDDLGDYELTELKMLAALPQKRSELQEDSIFLIDNSEFFFIFVKKGFFKYIDYFGVEASDILETEFESFSYESKVGRLANKFLEHLVDIYYGEIFPLILIFEG